MPAITSRKYMYSYRTLDNAAELDYLDTPFTDMVLPTAKIIVITQPFRYRPDLVSLKELGNFHMGWLISLHNNFMDPVFDYEVGREIKIPDMDTYYRYYNRNAKRAKP